MSVEKNSEYDRFTALVSKVVSAPKSAVREDAKPPRRRKTPKRNLEGNK